MLPNRFYRLSKHIVYSYAELEIPDMLNPAISWVGLRWMKVFIYFFNYFFLFLEKYFPKRKGICVSRHFL